MKKEEFPLELISIRNQKRLTQANLATALGVSERSVSLWERGKVIPRIGVRLTLALYLLGQEHRDYFLFDGEFPELFGPSSLAEQEREVIQLQEHLQKALDEAQVSDTLKYHVSQALKSLPELNAP